MQVSANFHISVKVPGEVIGQAPYSSVDVGGSLSFSQEYEDINEDEAIEIGLDTMNALANEVKAFVFNQAGIGSFVNEDGVSLPVIRKGEVTVTPNNVTVLPTAAPAPVVQDFSGPSASRDAQGRLLYKGRPVRLFDNRDEVAAAAPGTKEANRPHINMRFLDVDDSAPYNVKFKGFWPSYKGKPVEEYPEILALLAAQNSESAE